MILTNIICYDNSDNASVKWITSHQDIGRLPGLKPESRVRR